MIFRSGFLGFKSSPFQTLERVMKKPPSQQGCQDPKIREKLACKIGILLLIISTNLSYIASPLCFTNTHGMHETGIFTYTWLILMVNAGEHTIDGSYGIYY